MPRMVVAEAHLARREHHRLGLHAADFADLQRDAGAGDELAGQRGDADQPGARIRRAADDGAFDAIADIDAQLAQAVGVGVLGGLDDAGDAEVGERRAAILDAFDFEADGVEGAGDLIDAGVGVEMVAQPGEGELHRGGLIRARVEGWRVFAPPSHPTKGQRAFGNRYLAPCWRIVRSRHARQTSPAAKDRRGIGGIFPPTFTPRHATSPAPAGRPRNAAASAHRPRRTAAGRGCRA